MKEPKQDWREEFDSMFNWASQIKEKELGHWKVMYGFFPSDLKRFIEQVEKDTYNKAISDVLGVLPEAWNEDTEHCLKETKSNIEKLKLK